MWEREEQPSRLMLAVLGGLAEFERLFPLQRDAP
jgi:hypothetical protein